MNIIESTEAYEKLLSEATALDRDGLQIKHTAMATGAFPFLRATYYRWTELFKKHCAKLAAEGPLVFGVGDLHVQNFGTWRDGEGRLVWGIDDFDEADVALPLTSDLVRLAVSAVLSEDVKLSAKTICSAILEGYKAGLSADSAPLVLEGDHNWLRDLALEALKPPEKFWQKWLKEKTILAEKSAVDTEAVKALAESYPAGAVPESFRLTNPDNPKGLGSLGRKRFFAYNSDWQGGPIAREAKAAVPPATRLLKGSAFKSFVDEIQQRAIRSRDPVYRLHGLWVCKAIMANTGRIEVKDLAEEAKRERLLHAMGQETANIHRGTSGNSEELANGLKELKSGDLLEAIEELADATQADAATWKEHWEEQADRPGQ